MSITKEDVFEYHRAGRPGKIEVVPTKPLQTQRDLSLAYTPGVAEAVLEVARDPKAFIRAISAAGFATDPIYASKIIRMMDTYDLYQYDLP